MDAEADAYGAGHIVLSIQVDGLVRFDIAHCSKDADAQANDREAD